MSPSRYSTSYETSVLAEKHKRRQVEDDAVKLRNRLRQLEREAEKAEKRIVVTKGRARDILSQRDRNHHKELERQQYLEELQQEVERHKDEIVRVKEESRKNRLDNEAKLFQEKLAVVEETKLERLEIERMVVEQRLLDRRAALEKKEEVRRAALEGGSARTVDMKRKAQMAIDNYTAKISVEIEARREKEKEVQRMADLELDLIDRLKERQHEQQLAYEQLQAALNLGKSLRSRSARRGMPTQRPGAPQTGAGPQSHMQQPHQQVHTSVQHEFRQIFGEVADAAGPGIPQGCIATRQLRGLLERLEVFLDDEQLSQSIAQLDPANTNSIPLPEFMSWMSG